MKFLVFSQYLALLEKTPSRLEMTEILARLFSELEPREIKETSYLLLGGLTPLYQTLEFQLSTKMVIRTLARLAERSKTTSFLPKKTTPEGLFDEDQYQDTQQQAQELITKRYKAVGDIGQVAEELAAASISSTQQSVTTTDATDSDLDITTVFARLTTIAQEEGAGSQERKLLKLTELLEDLDPVSVRFVVRIVIGKMRLGFSVMTILDALSWAVTGDKSDTKHLEQAYQKKADIGLLASIYLHGDPATRLERLEQYSVTVGVPVIPALCQRLNSAEEIIEKMGKVVAEHKYDGLRVQIHYKQESKPGAGDGFVRTFTRNLEETTHMFPELLEAVKVLKCQSCILDGEAIGVDPTTGALQTFQKTITRKRKHDVEQAAQKVPMRFYIFDVLELDGVALIAEKLQERKERLRSLFETSEVLVQTDYIQTSNPEELRSFHTEALAQGLEGAVIKKADAPYQSGRKGWSWVKIKEEEGTTGKLSDTIDAVIMGYYAGRGKRAAFGVGALLAGVFDSEGAIVTLAKIGTGLTDEQLQTFKERSKSLLVSKKPPEYVVPKELKPDFWLEPVLVAEIAADEVTQSPLHSAGVALRFPRLIHFRDDKRLENATTLAEVLEIAALG